MASQYLKEKYKDVKPDEPPSYTRKEKIANWWYYNKWFVIGGVIILAIVSNIVYHILGFGEVKVDYYVAYVGSYNLPQQTVSALESAIAELASDSSDGKAVVRINQYPEVSAAFVSKLLADFERGESCFFILEDPEAFQEKYRILRALDGDIYYLPWASCPVLTSLELGDYQSVILDKKVSGSSQELLSGLYLARRDFRMENVPSNIADYDVLWETLTKGAKE